MLSVGIDLVNVGRFKFINTAGGVAFFDRVFTLKEQQACSGSLTLLATCFAAKEAVSKVLKTGLSIGVSDQVTCHSIEILNIKMNEPMVCLSGFAQQAATQLNLDQILVHSVAIGGCIVVSAIGASGISPVELQQRLKAMHVELVNNFGEKDSHLLDIMLIY